MCFSVSASLQAQLERAKRNRSEGDVLKITKRIANYVKSPKFHLSAFAHPQLLIYTKENAFSPELAFWGLIPEWTKDRKSVSTIWNKTLNSRLETIFEKPSFKSSAENKRCLVYVDGFFEFHHYKGKSYPFYVYSKNKEPLVLAGLWSEWFDRTKIQHVRSFSLVTTKANALIAKLHNNPKLKEPRTPLVLKEKDTTLWLDTEHFTEIDIIENLSIANEEILVAHPVQKLSGKNYLGNVYEVKEEHRYNELIFDF